MGTCFGVGNVFWQIENGENATGTHFQKRIFWAFKGLVWSQGSVYQMGEVPRVPKIPLTHFWPNAGKTCFDKLVLICTFRPYCRIHQAIDSQPRLASILSKQDGRTVLNAVGGRVSTGKQQPTPTASTPVAGSGTTKKLPRSSSGRDELITCNDAWQVGSISHIN